MVENSGLKSLISDDELTLNSSSKNMPQTKEECIEVMKKAIQKHGEDITVRQLLNDDEFCSQSYLADKSGLTWNELKKAAGSSKIYEGRYINGRKYTDDECIKIWNRIIKKHGADVEIQDINNDDEFPKWQTIRKYMGLSINEMKKKYGGAVNKSKINGLCSVDLFSSSKAYVVGVVLGDGCIYQRNGRKNGRIKLSVTDRGFAEKFARELCSCLSLRYEGLDSKYTELSYNTYSRQENNRKKTHEVKRSLPENIFNHFIDYQKLKDNTKEVLILGEEFRNYKEQLVAGLWDSEGSVTRDGIVHFCNTNVYIIDLYMNLLSHILDLDYEKPIVNDDIKTGRYGEYYIDARGKSQRLGDCKFYDIFLFKKYKQQFYEKIDPVIERKRRRFEGDDRTYENQDGVNPDNIIGKEEWYR